MELEYEITLWSNSSRSHIEIISARCETTFTHSESGTYLLREEGGFFLVDSNLKEAGELTRYNLYISDIDKYSQYNRFGVVIKTPLLQFLRRERIETIIGV